MEKLEFRTLKPHEIDVRIQSVKGNGAILLLYKDARCDMNILDETVGAFNWQRKHTRENANCIVSIYDWQKEEWVSKEDTGVESNSQAEKGLASDSFKRACFNWGIGRELYTAPFIWVNANGRSQNDLKYARFQVKEIEYDENRVINKLVIINEKTKQVEYSFGSNARPQAKPKTQAKASSSMTKGDIIREITNIQTKVDGGSDIIFGSLEKLGKETLEDMTKAELETLHKFLVSKANA